MYGCTGSPEVEQEAPADLKRILPDAINPPVAGLSWYPNVRALRQSSGRQDKCDAQEQTKHSGCPPDERVFPFFHCIYHLRHEEQISIRIHPFLVLQSHRSLKTKHMQSAWCIACQLEFLCGDLENQLKRGDFFPSSRDFRKLRFSIQSTVSDFFVESCHFWTFFSCPDEYDCCYERNILDMKIVTS